MTGAALRLVTASIYSCLAAQSAATGGLELRVPRISWGVLGQDAILDCVFVAARDRASDLVIHWMKLDSSAGEHTIYSFYHGREQWSAVLREFVNRTRHHRNNTSDGNCALVISGLTIADAGTYRAFVKTDPKYGEAYTRLQVTAPYSLPLINISTACTQNNTVLYRLTCSVSGGYPLASVHWHTDFGQDFTSDAHTSNTSNREGLISIISQLLITETSYKTYICSLDSPLQTPHLNISITLPDRSCGRSFTLCSAVTLAGLAIVLSLFVVTAVVRGPVSRRWTRLFQHISR